MRPLLAFSNSQVTLKKERKKNFYKIISPIVLLLGSQFPVHEKRERNYDR